MRRGRRGVYGDDGEEGSGPTDVQRRRAAVIQYVRDVQPGEVQAFIDDAPPSVVAAMKQTVSNMVGALPPQHFAVTISTVAESLASLMQTMLRTGYLLRGVQYQLELELALRSAAASMMQHATHQQQQQQQGDVVTQEVMAPPSPSTASSSASTTGSILFTPACPTELPASSTTTTTTSSSVPLPSAFPATAGTLISPEVVGASGGTSSSGVMVGGRAAGASGSTALEVQGWSQPEEQYAPGVQLSNVGGDVLRWHMQQGLERMPAASYIHLLEQKVQQLQQQAQQLQQQQQQQAAYGASASGFQPFPPLFSSAAAAGGAMAGAAAGATAASMLAGGAAGGVEAMAAAASSGNNPVLAYLRSLDAPSLAALGACGPDVSDAMTLFVSRLMGTTEHEQLRQMTSEFTAIELSKLLFWLLVVGWSLRAMEVRLEVEEGFGSV